MSQHAQICKIQISYLISLYGKIKITENIPSQSRKIFWISANEQNSAAFEMRTKMQYHCD